MSELLKALQGASPAEVAAALLSLSETRDGLAYDVGMALYEAGAGKDVPGPDPYDQNPKSLGSGSINVSGFDPHREAEAVEAFREIWGHKIPTFDETDPKWLKATKAERKAAKRKAEDWVKYPNRDQVPGFITALRSRKSGMSISRPSFFDGAPKTRAEAEAEVARFASYGVRAHIEGYEAPAASHRVSLRDLSRGPC